jgi:hypothetical protein
VIDGVALCVGVPVLVCEIDSEVVVVIVMDMVDVEDRLMLAVEDSLILGVVVRVAILDIPKCVLFGEGDATNAKGFAFS